MMEKTNRALLTLGLVLLTCAGRAQLMVGGSEQMSLDTRTGDILVNNGNWFQDGSIGLWLSTRWGEAPRGFLTVNGNVRKELADDVEEGFVLPFPANSSGSYVCEWAVGETVYRRTLVTDGNREIAHGAELALDTRTEMRIASASGEELSYDVRWAEGATTAVVSCGDEEVIRGVAGIYRWLPRFAGNSILSLSLQNQDGVEIVHECAVFKADAASARIDRKSPWETGLFEGCKEIREVMLDCDLTSFVLADGSLCALALKDLFPDSYASLTNVVLGADVTVLPDGFFDGCVALENVAFPSALKDFGDSDWRWLGERLGKQGLWIENGWVLAYVGDAPAEVAIPDGVTGIASYAFEGQPSLETVSLPPSLRTIGVRAFALCTSLERLDVPDGVERIGDAAFRDCTYLQELSLPSGLKRLGDAAFANCTSLAGLVCPEGLAEIGAEAFSNCWRMLSVSVPASLETVGENAFFGCSRLTGATVPTHVKPLAALLPDVAANLTDIAIAEGETALVPEAFAGCAALARIALPPALAEIPDGAFRDCASLSEIAIPAGVVRIGDGAFAGCSRLASLVVPAGVTALGADVFSGCAALKAVYFLSATAPAADAAAYAGTSDGLVSYVVKDSTGWDGLATSKSLPQAWPATEGRAIEWWEPNVFEATFLGNGGEPASQAVAETTGAGYALPAESPTRVGATFAGWWTEPVNGGQVKTTTKVELTRPHTLYAHWRGHVYMVAFDLNGTAGVLPPLPAEYGAAAALPVCTVRRRDFDFAGWSLASDGAAVDFADGAEVLNLTDEDGATVMLYAVWTPRTWTAADYLGAGGLAFASDGDAAWFADEETSHDGDGSMRSGAIGKSQRSTLKTSVKGKGVLSFWWKVVCEPGDPDTGDLYDYLELTVDGVRPAAVPPIAGDVDWTRVVVRIDGDAAEHEVAWSFVKDDWDEEVLADVAWVDEVTWTPDPVTLTFGAGEATGGDAPEAVVSACGETVVLPGAGSLVRDGFGFVGWSDGTTTYAAGAAYAVGAADVAFVAVWRELSLGDALNAPELAFAAGGDAAWTLDAAVSRDGVASLRSGAVAAGQSSWVETSVTNAGTLAFWWKADGLLYRGKPANFVQVEVDGVAVTNATVADWTLVSVEVAGAGAHAVRWTYVQTRAQTSGEACAWLDEVTWTPAVSEGPTVAGDDGASVTGDAETGFVVKPSAGTESVVVTIPDGMDAAKVEVVVSPDVKTVTPHGAAVRVVRGTSDITDYLDIPAAVGGVIDLGAATVKDEIVKEVLSVEKGAEITLTAEDPVLKTADTRPGLTYRLYEGTALDGLQPGVSTVGDGSPWTPAISVKGGTSGFYMIKVEK